ncbi:MAG: protein phosphatase 2C domain-containing protein [Pseudomonadota bacterium]
MTRSLVSYQASSVLYLGQRDNQEDALAMDFPLGSDTGFAVLSDGMGGHNAGEVASRIVVTEVFRELKFLKGHGNILQEALEGPVDNSIRDALLEAADIANACVADVANEAPEAHGMGATLVVPFFDRDQLSWISIGDSPLYLHRNGRLNQLNEDHSMGPHIDMMVRSGMLTERNGRDHPDRNCLTSVLVGKPISRIDCPEEPTHLMDGDIVLAASDGVQSIPHHEIEQIIERHCEDTTETIAQAVLTEIETRADPEQDNLSLVVVKISKSDTQRKTARNTHPKREAFSEPYAVSDAPVHHDISRLTPRRPNRLHKSLARIFPTSPSTVK